MTNQSSAYQKLSIIIPCYNEEATLAQVVHTLEKIEFIVPEIEIVIVDDCSKDRSLEIATGLSQDYHNIKVFSHEKNKGKGAALKTGFQSATGDILVVQDADLEYNPEEFNEMLPPILEGKAKVVYGSRYLKGDNHKVLDFAHTMGNRLLTLLSNIFSDIYVTDMETCYKMFTREIIEQIDLKEKKFGVEPEITAKISTLRRKERFGIWEVGISYEGRTYEEGKKIGLKDAFSALRCIVKYNTTFKACLVKYILSGLVVFCSQLLILNGLVFAGDASSESWLNLANLLSIEASILTGFYIHSRFTWRQKYLGLLGQLKQCLNFHAVTAIGAVLRISLFSVMIRYTSLNYNLIAVIGIVVALCTNFFGYNRWVFKK